MAHDLVALLGPEGVARTADLARKVDRHSVDGWRTRALAAVHATDGVLSHTSALTVWRLAPQGDPVHVSVRAGRRALRRPGLVVHRVQELTPDRLGPYPVTDVARALIDTWGWPPGGTDGVGSWRWRAARSSPPCARGASVPTSWRRKRPAVPASPDGPSSGGSSSWSERAVTASWRSGASGRCSTPP